MIKFQIKLVWRFKESWIVFKMLIVGWCWWFRSINHSVSVSLPLFRNSMKNLPKTRHILSFFLLMFFNLILLFHPSTFLITCRTYYFGVVSLAKYSAETSLAFLYCKVLLNEFFFLLLTLSLMSRKETTSTKLHFAFLTWDRFRWILLV